MKHILRHCFVCLLFYYALFPAYAKAVKPLKYVVSMDNPATHTFHVTLRCNPETEDSILLKMPDWTPGYYQLMDYASAIQNFSAKDAEGNDLSWKRSGKTGWSVPTRKVKELHVEYDVKTSRKFVATSYLDEEHGYITPAGVFMYVSGKINTPAEIEIRPFKTWNRIATGLDSVSNKIFTYTAPDFDILYDSPMLIGNLQELPPFYVKGIPHRFIGYKMGDFDSKKLMSDIQKIVENASALIGDIPYKHYTFIAIGPGQGGIEHLNSTTISFSGDLLDKRGWAGMLGFITHEYFHHYNVKRIRPVELGPFDYDRGSKTNSLWVSEGLTVYYEPIIMRESGLITKEGMLEFFRTHIINVENQPSRLFQTLAQASAETWSDGPFGRTGDEVNKTISYYQKGPVIGLLFDFAIRHETQNRKSLDDVMRQLYNDYYKNKNRGFTESELKKTIEETAGKPLDELFSYIYTTAGPDYKKYFSYAGLEIDTTSHALPGGYFGADIASRQDSLFIAAVEWKSPAWNVGLRAGTAILKSDGFPAGKLKNVMQDSKSGDKLFLTVFKNKTTESLEIVLGTKTEKQFTIRPLNNPNALQKAIFAGWYREKIVANSN
ncbi:M61 family metallopeptidase [Dyadobacter sediminis]|uniref:M61 family metallopeptidase n=1 Tax=Dyadobacter sediminis TaxID=1493691 RepID=A0A5R9K8F9_9BACT|nr:M61 family metallopeptidase [Dyadobacter sediminis]TLU90379.1 M61 family metallopeptidase [Dyadobacter sediminis]GGC07297.1 peptidase M61 [Dyadobacter sediminis]